MIVPEYSDAASVTVDWLASNGFTLVEHDDDDNMTTWSCDDEDGQPVLTLELIDPDNDVWRALLLDPDDLDYWPVDIYVQEQVAKLLAALRV